MNQPRRLDVLSAIVEDYVRSGEPVGSKALVQRHRLGVSSATVRNDMAALEDEGLITAPHASAGRIPTDKGYRAFVDRIATVRPLTEPEKRAIAEFLGSSDSLDEAMARTVRLLSQLTHQVALVQYPVRSGQTVRHLDVVALEGEAVLVVLITDQGRVLQRTLDLRPRPQETGLHRIRDHALEALRGHGLSEAPGLLRQAVTGLPPHLVPAAQCVHQTISAWADEHEQSRLLMAGTSYLVRAGEDFSRSVAPILEALEEQVVMLRLLSGIQEDAHGVGVRIGPENQDTSLAETSLVATGYGPRQEAKLGVLGPLRMDYPGTMAAVRSVAGYLSRILQE